METSKKKPSTNHATELTTHSPEGGKKSQPLQLNHFFELFDEFELTKRMRLILCIAIITVLAGASTSACAPSANSLSAPDQATTQETVSAPTLDPQESQAMLKIEIDRRRERAVMLKAKITAENPNFLAAIDAAEEKADLEFPNSHPVFILRGKEVIAALDYQAVGGEGWLDSVLFNQLQVGDEIWLLQKDRACGGRLCIDALLEDFQKDPRPEEQKSIENAVRVKVEIERGSMEGTNDLYSYVVYTLKNGEQSSKKLTIVRTGYLGAGAKKESWAYGFMPVKSAGSFVPGETLTEVAEINGLEEISYAEASGIVAEFFGQ